MQGHTYCGESKKMMIYVLLDVDNELSELSEEETETAKEEDEVVLSLPPGLLVQEAKCVSIWKDSNELGFGYIDWSN